MAFSLEVTSGLFIFLIGHLTTYFLEKVLFCIEGGLYSVYFKEMNTFENFIIF